MGWQIGEIWFVFPVRTSSEKTDIERHLGATDTQIDQLVYELYGLTKEETRIVEGDAR